jgi:hypothetical protein
MPDQLYCLTILTIMEKRNMPPCAEYDLIADTWQRELTIANLAHSNVRVRNGLFSAMDHFKRRPPVKAVTTVIRMHMPLTA